jgi:glutamate 5-kinase
MNEKVLQAKRIVLKLGTQIVIREDGSLAKDRLAAFADQCAELVRQGRDVLIVSSGAVGLGRQVLNLREATRLSLPEKQACAAVGQSILMDIYSELFTSTCGRPWKNCWK